MDITETTCINRIIMDITTTIFIMVIIIHHTTMYQTTGILTITTIGTIEITPILNAILAIETLPLEEIQHTIIKDQAFLQTAGHQQ